MCRKNKMHLQHVTHAKHQDLFYFISFTSLTSLFSICVIREWEREFRELLPLLNMRTWEIKIWENIIVIPSRYQYTYFCVRSPRVNDSSEAKLYKTMQTVSGVGRRRRELRDGHYMTQMVIYCSIFCTSIWLCLTICIICYILWESSATSELLIKCSSH